MEVDFYNGQTVSTKHMLMGDMTELCPLSPRPFNMVSGILARALKREKE